MTADERPRCPYCGAQSDLALHYRDQRMTTCRTCQAWFVWPRPTAAEMLMHYDQNVAGMPALLRARRSGTAQNGWYEWLGRRISRLAAGKSVHAVADVGAGALELTACLAGQFPRACVEAWDLFADGLERPIPEDIAGRVALRRVDLNQLDQHAHAHRLFDVVSCVAVIEHVLHPVELLRLLRSSLAPGGFAYVVGPDVGSAAHHVLRKWWPYYCPDEHLTLPSIASITTAVAKLGGGKHSLRRMNVRYSLKYLLRYLRVPIPVPAGADFLVPIPAGAFELIWEKS